MNTYDTPAQAFLANCWQVGLNTVTHNGQLELFMNSQKVLGFEQARASWERAWLAFVSGKTRFDFNKPLTGETVSDFVLTLIRCNPAQGLKSNAAIVGGEAARGNVQFFKDVVAAMRQHERNKFQASFTEVFLQQWLHGFLWLMSDDVGLQCMQKITNVVTRENYKKCRQRLELVGYETAHRKPLITGITKTGFRFRKGDKLGA